MDPSVSFLIVMAGAAVAGSIAAAIVIAAVSLIGTREKVRNSSIPAAKADRMTVVQPEQSPPFREVGAKTTMACA